mgnify:CR=1 FL=1
MPLSITQRNDPSATAQAEIPSGMDARRSKRLDMSCDTLLVVIRMNAFDPTIAHFLFHRAASEIEPLLVKVIAQSLSVPAIQIITGAVSAMLWKRASLSFKCLLRRHALSDVARSHQQAFFAGDLQSAPLMKAELALHRSGCGISIQR